MKKTSQTKREPFLGTLPQIQELDQFIQDYRPDQEPLSLSPFPFTEMVPLKGQVLEILLALQMAPKYRSGPSHRTDVLLKLKKFIRDYKSDMKDHLNLTKQTAKMTADNEISPLLGEIQAQIALQCLYADKEKLYDLEQSYNTGYRNKITVLQGAEHTSWMWAGGSKRDDITVCYQHHCVHQQDRKSYLSYQGGNIPLHHPLNTALGNTSFRSRMVRKLPTERIKRADPDYRGRGGDNTWVLAQKHTDVAVISLPVNGKKEPAQEGQILHPIMSQNTRGASIYRNPRGNRHQAPYRGITVILGLYRDMPQGNQAHRPLIGDMLAWCGTEKPTNGSIGIAVYAHNESLAKPPPRKHYVVQKLKEITEITRQVADYVTEKTNRQTPAQRMPIVEDSKLVHLDTDLSSWKSHELPVHGSFRSWKPRLEIHPEIPENQENTGIPPLIPEAAITGPLSPKQNPKQNQDIPSKHWIQFPISPQAHQELRPWERESLALMQYNLGTKNERNDQGNLNPRPSLFSNQHDQWRQPTFHLVGSPQTISVNPYQDQNTDRAQVTVPRTYAISPYRESSIRIIASFLITQTIQNPYTRALWVYPNTGNHKKNPGDQRNQEEKKQQKHAEQDLFERIRETLVRYGLDPAHLFTERDQHPANGILANFPPGIAVLSEYELDHYQKEVIEWLAGAKVPNDPTQNVWTKQTKGLNTGPILVLPGQEYTTRDARETLEDLYQAPRVRPRTIHAQDIKNIYLREPSNGRTILNHHDKTRMTLHHLGRSHKGDCWLEQPELRTPSRRGFEMDLQKISLSKEETKTYDLWVKAWEQVNPHMLQKKTPRNLFFAHLLGALQLGNKDFQEQLQRDTRQGVLPILHYPYSNITYQNVFDHPPDDQKPQINSILELATRLFMTHFPLQKKTFNEQGLEVDMQSNDQSSHHDPAQVSILAKALAIFQSIESEENPRPTLEKMIIEGSFLQDQKSLLYLRDTGVPYRIFPKTQPNITQEYIKAVVVPYHLQFDQNRAQEYPNGYSNDPQAPEELSDSFQHDDRHHESYTRQETIHGERNVLDHHRATFQATNYKKIKHYVLGAMPFTVLCGIDEMDPYPEAESPEKADDLHDKIQNLQIQALTQLANNISAIPGIEQDGTPNEASPVVLPFLGDIPAETFRVGVTAHRVAKMLIGPVGVSLGLSKIPCYQSPYPPFLTPGSLACKTIQQQNEQAQIWSQEHAPPEGALSIGKAHYHQNKALSTWERPAYLIKPFRDSIIPLPGISVHQLRIRILDGQDGWYFSEIMDTGVLHPSRSERSEKTPWHPLALSREHREHREHREDNQTNQTRHNPLQKALQYLRRPPHNANKTTSWREKSLPWEYALRINRERSHQILRLTPHGARYSHDTDDDRQEWEEVPLHLHRLNTGHPANESDAPWLDHGKPMPKNPGNPKSKTISPMFLLEGDLGLAHPYLEYITKEYSLTPAVVRHVSVIDPQIGSTLTLTGVALTILGVCNLIEMMNRK